MPDRERTRAPKRSRGRADASPGLPDPDRESSVGRFVRERRKANRLNQRIGSRTARITLSWLGQMSNNVKTILA